MNKYLNLFELSPNVNYKTEVLAGLTVALVLVPQGVAFAMLVGLSPLAGLYAAFVLGLTTALLGGRPGMISGAAGATAVVLVHLYKSHGTEYVLAAVVLSGVVQLLAGVLRLAKFMRLVPHSVVFGFVNGLAITIFWSQIKQFQIDEHTWMSGSSLYWFAGLVLLTMLLIWGLPKITKAIPASLMAILIVFVLVSLVGIDTKRVGDLASIKGGLPPFHWPQVPLQWETLSIIMPYAFTIAAIGLLESLLTLNILDEMTESRGRSNKEALALGLGNVLSGVFSGMGGCGLLGQSLINVSAGARTRISAIVAAITLLVFVLAGANWVEQLPMAALTGLMIMVAIGTFEWTSLRAFNKMPRNDIAVMLLVTFITVYLHNLALAVLIGVIISALNFAWDNAKRIRARKYLDDQGVKHYEIYGPLFFASITAFNDKFDPINDPDEIVINFAESRVADMSAIEALNKITERYHKLGKKVQLKHLSPDCKRLLKNADKLIVVNILEDPTYKVMVDEWS
ncbi:SulP family inorganic anion transporter [Eisenibacter elegans]|uniref:SulP family inorganic anion transporter n=1 Tax=Eisenibacter elegans TaxID=997 RepID=UPI0003F784BB|nr:SulP family inorganic anion transporter [Eisenibacter elegans]